MKVIGIEEGIGIQANGINNLFSEITSEKFSNFRNEMDIHIQDACRTPKKQDQTRISLRNFIINILILENKGRKLKATRKMSNHI